MAQYGRYRIELDNDWALDDLYKFPRTYEQIYFFFASLDESLIRDLERADRAYSAFPWQGGYSAVNFYNQLKLALYSANRPKIVAIQKASPGFLDLGLVVQVALSVATIVKAICYTIDKANSTYGNIRKGMSERSLLKLDEKQKELKFNKEQMKFILHSTQQMAKLLGFSNLSELNERTGHPYLTLKILMSVYRRIVVLAEYSQKEKVSLTDHASQLPLPQKTRRRAKATTKSIK